MSGGEFRQSSALPMYPWVRTNRLKANVIESGIQNHIYRPQRSCGQGRPFVKDSEALVKWTSDFQNPLVHTQIYLSTIFILYGKYFWIFIYYILNMIVYLYQLLLILKSEIFNDFK